MASCQQIFDLALVDFLAAAVVHVQVDITLANTVMVEVLQHRHNSVFPFPTVDALIKQEVDLLWKRFTRNTQQTTLPGTLVGPFPGVGS